MNSNSIWQDLKVVMTREWVRISRRPIYIIGMVVIPIVSMLILLSIMSKGLPHQIPLAIVDEDQTSTSRSLIRNLDAFEQTQVTMVVSSMTEARIAMQKGEVYGIMVIPKDFGSDAITGKRPKIECYTNNAYMMAGSLLYKDLRMISELASGKVILERGQAYGKTTEEIMGQAQPIAVDSKIVGNPWLNYSIYLNSTMLPGILQLLILQLTAYSIGIEIKERSAGRWLRRAGGSITIALSGKFIIHTIVYMLTGLCCFALMYGFYHFPLHGGLWPMLLGLFLFIISAEALGIFFFTLLPILRLSVSLASLFGMLSFSMAGFSYPVTAMYGAVHALTKLFPLHHYYMIYVDQALNGRDIYYTIPSYLSLILFLLLPIMTIRILNDLIRRVPYIP